MLPPLPSHNVWVEQTDTDQAERAANTEATFRDANEEIEDKRRELGLERERTPVLCECADERCTVVLRLTAEEYEHARSNPRWFLLAPGHLFLQGHVSEELDGYWIVEKEDISGEIAEERDPRS